MYSRSDKVWGSVLYYLMALLGKLPAWWHYCWADLLAFLLERVFRYRHQVVVDQLQACFPACTPLEYKRMIHDTYANIANIFVEYFMLAGMSRKALRRRLSLDGSDLLRKLHQESGAAQVFLALGHLGNWEWFTGYQALLPFTQMGVLYRRQKGAFNYTLRLLRSKFGARLLDKNFALRQIIHDRKETKPRLYIFVADQTPSLPNTRLFLPLFGRPTAFLLGLEEIARAMRAPVVYADVFRPRRGYYHTELSLITADASVEPPLAVTKRFAARLEQTIRRAPGLWLWTHRRWKYSPESVPATTVEKKIREEEGC